jgi:K(+)-stimulated pyrophosphate-energized sodium pump
MAFSGGSIMGMIVVGVGVLGISFCFIFWSPETITSFGMGASSIALFARVGGGIFTKAADVGADLVGKVEAGIPEDDPRNPAVIADNVGDNVGDIAGMGADLFESYVNSIIAAMAIGATATGVVKSTFPLVLSGWGIVASIFGCILVCNIDKLPKKALKLAKKIPNVEKWLNQMEGGNNPALSLRVGTFGAGAAMILGSFILCLIFFGLECLQVFLSVVSGVLAGVLIGFVTEYYTSSDYKPVKDIASSSETGPATVILSGIGIGMLSTGIPVLLIVSATLLSFWLYGIYGVACSAVGMLSITGIALSVDAYGPIADNSGGIAQMSNLEPEVRKITDKLDSIGNTTAAMGKGLAIGSAALTALSLFVAYAYAAKIESINLKDAKVMGALLLGGMLPFIFCALSIKAVGRAAEKMIDEVRRQFREIAGIMDNTAQPEYEKCVEISTQAALREMILPGVIALASPILVGFILEKEALGGLLGGAIVSGVMLALFMANAGGAWDNAKKYIEEGNHGGKKTPQHAAAVVGDTVGDPFKDTAGPSLNILIKLMTVVSLVIAPLLA